MSLKNYYVYITTNPGKKVLYTGVTNELRSKAAEHRENKGDKKPSRVATIVIIWFTMNIFRTSNRPYNGKKKYPDKNIDLHVNKSGLNLPEFKKIWQEHMSAHQNES